MENGVIIDTNEVKKVIATADVFAVGFPLFPERLVVDTRSDEHTPPMVEVLEPVASMEERFFWLGQHRPSLGMPKRFMLFVWPHRITFLKETGVWQALRRRLRDEGWKYPDRALNRTFNRLLELERSVNLGAIRGDDQHQTLWTRR